MNAHTHNDVRHFINEFSVNWITRKRTHIKYTRVEIANFQSIVWFTDRKKNFYTSICLTNGAKGIFEQKFNLRTESHFHNKRTGKLCMARKSNEEKKSHAIVCSLCISMCSSSVCLWVCAVVWGVSVFDSEFLVRSSHSL